jgi:hypothetical protein
MVLMSAENRKAIRNWMAFLSDSQSLASLKSPFIRIFMD